MFVRAGVRLNEEISSAMVINSPSASVPATIHGRCLTSLAEIGEAENAVIV